MTTHLHRRLLDCVDPLAGKKVFVGFDAFIDLVVRPIQSGDARKVDRYYERMDDFAAFIARCSGRNGSVELDERMEKLGGNAPNLASAVNVLGASVTAIAPFGSPSVHACFAEMSRRCELYSVGNPGISLALEFADGKVMLAMNRQNNHLDYRTLTTHLTVDRLRAILTSCDFLALVNWSELPGSTDLLDGLSRDVFPAISRPTPLLVDLSDCTRRNPEELRDYLAKLAALPSNLQIILSLNQNEASMVFQAMDIDPALSDAGKGRALREGLHLDWVVLHHWTHTAIVSEEGFDSCKPRDRKNPVLQTGAGDNFNAGLCAGRLLGMSAGDCLTLATETSGFYVETGRNPAWTELVDAISDQTKEKTI
jgi:sugar/nucleoside kinase (ribokinase family)